MKYLFLFLIICVLPHSAPLSALSASSAPGGELVVKSEHESITLYAWTRRTISMSFTPESVELGVDCGMPDMCGIEICLCGSADTWGACSCNGLRSVWPEVAIWVESERTVRASYRDGELVLRGLRHGVTTVTVAASLPRYGDARQVFEVTVDPVPVYWYFLAGAAFFTVALFACLCLRTYVRKERGK